MSKGVPPTTRRIFHDWTRDPLPPSLVLTPYQRFIRDDVDWNKSPVGPMAQWPPLLRQMVLFIERDPVPYVSLLQQVQRPF